MSALDEFLASFSGGDAICEIAGGEARTTRILIRMNDPRIATGPDFDLITDVDLTDKHEQHAFWQYRRRRKPKVCVMSQMCRSFGGWSRLHKVTNQGTWQHNYDTVDKPLAKFAGEVAQEQFADELDFVNEQPVGSTLY